MKIPVRDVTSLPMSEIAGKGIYSIRRRLGRAPEHAAARRLRDQWEVEGAGSGTEGGPEVLIFTPRDWSKHVQEEAVVGHALRLRGASVRVLGCGGGLEVCDHNNCYRAPPMPCGSCVRYRRDAAAAHGFPFHELDYDDPEPWPELDALSVDELYDVVWDGLPLGSLIEVPSQWFNMTTQVHTDPMAPLNIRRFLRSARRVAVALRRHLDEHPPDVVVLLNGKFAFEAVLWELCRQRGIEVVTYEQGFVAGTVVFRRNEAACYYDQSAWWPERAERPLTEAEDDQLTRFLDDRRTGGQTNDAYWREVRFDGVERSRTGSMALMFTNLTWDSAVIGRQAAFAGMHEWIAGAIEAFADRPDDELVIRIHPAEAKLRGKVTREPVGELVAAAFPDLPPNVRLVGSDDPTSSYTLMAQADVGLVYTSTTGMELALAGTPVLVAGTTHYRGKGFTEDAADPADFVRRLGAMLDDPAAFAPDVERARRYASLFFFGSPMAFPFVDLPLTDVGRLTVEDLDELRPGRHADLDRICAGILGDGDFGPGRPPEDPSGPRPGPKSRGSGDSAL